MFFSPTNVRRPLDQKLVLATFIIISIFVYCAEFATGSRAGSMVPALAFDLSTGVGGTTTSRQAILNYNAPDTLPCTVEVSENSSYTPVINDVNPVLFVGSNIDNRAGSLGAGTTARSFVVGTVPNMKGLIDNLASDGKRYGRALTPAISYFARVTCGAQVGTVSWTTKNRPLGMTRGDEQPIAGAGSYAFPTVNSIDRNQVIADPVTGILLRKMAIPSDDTFGGDISFFGSGAPWPFAQSTITDAVGTPGYLATMPSQNGTARLYFVTDNASRYLGTIVLSGGTLPGIGTNYVGVQSGSHFGTNPTQVFATAIDTNNDVHVVRCQLPVSGSSYYNSNVAPGTYALCNWTDMTPNPNNLSALMVAFDATYDKSKFGNLTNSVVQGNYLLFHALRGIQDSYGWLAAVDISGPTART